MSAIAVAVSGGVDSLAALLLLRQDAHKIFAIHALFTASAAPPAGLAELCDQLKIPLRVADLREEFAAKVVEPFLAEYALGRTPNPCAHCNRLIKFGALLQAARQMGAERLATGHYASIRKQAPVLACALDSSKDQSYFLSLVPNKALECALFPLGSLTKEEARSLVARAGVAPPIPQESQDICFIGQAGIKAFLEDAMGVKPGPILLCGKKGVPLREIGQHQGLCHYTIGQRKGLGIAWREPLHVLAVDARANALIVGPKNMAAMSACFVEEANFLAPPALWPEELLVRLRYRQPLQPAKVYPGVDGFKIELKTAILSTAPGQIAAVYDTWGNVLAGGVVARIVREE